jgi:uncharacterized BrkB/YihY/UPF0761 family membrane protein
MRKVVIGLVILLSFLILSQIAGVALAEEEENGEAHAATSDMEVCTSTIFLLVLVLIIIALIIMGNSRRAKKA